MQRKKWFSVVARLIVTWSHEWWLTKVAWAPDITDVMYARENSNTGIEESLRVQLTPLYKPASQLPKPFLTIWKDTFRQMRSIYTYNGFIKFILACFWLLSTKKIVVIQTTFDVLKIDGTLLLLHEKAYWCHVETQREESCCPFGPETFTNNLNT